MRAEEVHASNYADVLAKLTDEAYINSTYGVVYRCPVCGEVVKDRPSRCPICGTDGTLFVMYNETYFNLYASVQGETNANATYIAFAEKARAEGHLAVARLFLATADAEAKHAEEEWAILLAMGATMRPVAATPVVGTTAENLQAAFEGETYEYTVMYPGFVTTAGDEGMTSDPYNARRIFNFAMRAEEVHAGNYADVLAKLTDAVYINSTYGVVYRCPVCGEVVTSRPGRCPICGTDGSAFVVYMFEPELNISIDSRLIVTPIVLEANCPAFSLYANENVSGTVIVAAYNAQGCMVNIEMQPFSLASGHDVSIQVSIPALTGLTYKFFIWDNDFVPMTAITSVDDID